MPARPENRDTRAIFQRGHFRPKEHWFDAEGQAFNPGNYYVHGGNSKFYGAVLIRYRAEDFDGIAHADGDAPAWPFRYAELEPWYDQAEALFRVRGEAGEDPTEPPRSGRLSVSAGAGRAADRRRCASGCARSACIRSRCRSASTSSSG